MVFFQVTLPLGSFLCKGEPWPCSVTSTIVARSNECESRALLTGTSVSPLIGLSWKSDSNWLSWNQLCSLREEKQPVLSNFLAAKRLCRCFLKGHKQKIIEQALYNREGTKVHRERISFQRRQDRVHGRWRQRENALTNTENVKGTKPSLYVNAS